MYISPAKVRPMESDQRNRESDEPNQDSSGSINVESMSLHRNPIRARPWELKETVRCVFCRGKNCRRCGRNAYMVAVDPAMRGFHCNWITDEILAMQRPADELIDSIDLLGQFKEQKISAIINLTVPGEHPFCGFGLKPSGFPYSPEKFMEAGSEYISAFTSRTLMLLHCARSQTLQLLVERHDCAHCLLDAEHCQSVPWRAIQRGKGENMYFVALCGPLSV